MAFLLRAYLLHTSVQQWQQREGTEPTEPTIQSSGTTADSTERRLIAYALLLSA